VFYAQGRPLGPVPRFDANRALLANSWYAGPPGARDRFLDFYLDGTFRYAYRPFDPEDRAVSRRGEFSYNGTKLRLKAEEGVWVEARAQRRSLPAEDGRVQVELEIASEEFADSLTRVWGDSP
jgi:hypothetical protein